MIWDGVSPQLDSLVCGRDAFHLWNNPLLTHRSDDDESPLSWPQSCLLMALLLVSAPLLGSPEQGLCVCPLRLSVSLIPRFIISSMLPGHLDAQDHSDGVVTVTHHLHLPGGGGGKVGVVQH